MDDAMVRTIIETFKEEQIDLAVTLPEEPTYPLTEALRADSTAALSKVPKFLFKPARAALASLVPISISSTNEFVAAIQPSG